jgi:DNA-binding HxlR family transcriptional regulator
LTGRGEALRPALAELERWGHEQLLDTVATTTGTSVGETVDALSS